MGLVRTLALVATRCARADAADDWASWYRDHLDDLGADATVTATRWRLVDAPAPGGPGPGHTHVTRLEFSTPPTESLDALLGRRAELRSAGRIHPAHAEVGLQVWTAHGEPVEAAGGSFRAAITAEVLCTDPAREAEWDRWYDEQHLPDMMATGAFTRGTRWIRHPRPAIGCRHLTVYDIAEGDAATAVAVSAAAMPALIAAGRKHECHAGGPTMALDAE